MRSLSDRHAPTLARLTRTASFAGCMHTQPGLFDQEDLNFKSPASLAMSPSTDVDGRQCPSPVFDLSETFASMVVPTSPKANVAVTNVKAGAAVAVCEEPATHTTVRTPHRPHSHNRSRCPPHCITTRRPPPPPQLRCKSTRRRALIACIAAANSLGVVVESQDLFDGVEENLSGRDCPSPTFDVEESTGATPDLVKPAAYAIGLFEDEYDSDGSVDISGREAPMPLFDLEDELVAAENDANVEVGLTDPAGFQDPVGFQDPAEYTSVSIPISPLPSKPARCPACSIPGALFAGYPNLSRLTLSRGSLSFSLSPSPLV